MKPTLITFTFKVAIVAGITNLFDEPSMSELLVDDEK
jgi:hypothetical protein